MTKNEVLAIMGEPVKNETFNRPDIWFYYFNMNWGDGFITEDECFPLVFDNGKLAGWGSKYYASHRAAKKLKPEADELKKSSENKAATKEVKKTAQASSKTVTPAGTAAPRNTAAVKKSEEKKTEEKKK